MRRMAACCILLGLALPVFSPAQERGAASQEEAPKAAGGKEESPSSFWAWANFVLLAGGLGYLTRKKAGPYFAARSLAIRKNLLESQELLAEAEAQMAVAEQKFAMLQADIETLQAEAIAENEAEVERIRRLAAAEMAKIEAQAEQEIANAGRAARLELKRYAASLALQSAERKIRARITSKDQGALVAAFVDGLDRPGPRAQSSI